MVLKLLRSRNVITPSALLKNINNINRKATTAPLPTLYTRRYYAAMATATKIVLGGPNVGVAGALGQTPQSAKVTSDLLQENHEKHHIFFNEEGFHNHIVHHLLALYAFGASPVFIKKGYADNNPYQRPLATPDENVVEKLFDASKFSEFLAEEKYYSDYLTMFQKEMDSKGWKETVNKYLFDDTGLARDMLVRLFAGFLHPFIHFGYGVEHEQPAIIAEALAQTAVHDNWPKPFLEGCDEAAGKDGNKSTKTLLQLIEECGASDQLKDAAHYDDPQKNKGVLKRAPEAMINIAKQWGVYEESEIEEKMAEAVNIAGYITGAAQRPDKEVKMDFFFMHCINSSIFLPAIVKQDWIPASAKMKIITWHGRLTANMYVSRHNPKLDIGEIRNYVPREDARSNPWLGVIDRAVKLSDDGHTVKFIRACANGELVTRGKESRKGFVLVGDDWVKLANMVMDSAEADPHNKWVRSTGFDEAWEKFGPRRKDYKGKL